MSKKLRVFDFDDTLFHTSGKVMVTHADGSIEPFTPAQYAVYDPRSGDKFDYSQFVSVVDPKIIRSVAKSFYKIINAGGDDRLTVILTARGPDSVPHIQNTLQKYFRVNIPIIAVNSSNPQTKADWIKNKIDAGFDDVFFVDDSPKNIKAVYVAVKDLPIKYKIVDLSGPRRFQADNRPGQSQPITEIKTGDILREFNGKRLENIKVGFNDQGEVDLLELYFEDSYKALVIDGDYLDARIV